MSASLKNREWTSTEIFLFRLVFIFFVILSIPYDLHLYRSLSGSFFSFENLFQLATYRTAFVPESLYVGIRLEGYYNWLIALVLALIGTLLWGRSKYGKDRTAHNELYYWLRALLRYRLALAAIFIGIVKVFPIQIPDLTLSDLHTEYGELLLWKLYYLTNGIATAGYIPVIGFLEVLGGLLLLHKRTTVIGAGLLLAVLLNVVLINYVYDIGEQVYSSFLFLLAFVILLHDLPRLYRLLFREASVQPDTYTPRYSSKVGTFRPYLQVLFLLAIATFSVQAYVGWADTNYPFPRIRGIAGATGVYDVKDFVLNGDTIPYSLVDSSRWQDVVFEEWNTLTIRDNSPVKVDSLKPRIVYQSDRYRNYEQLGNAGRHFYRYEYAKHDGGEKSTLKLSNKTDTSRFYHFVYEKPTKDEILLDGIDWKGDSLSVRLERLPKRYLLREGRRKPIKIY